MPTPLEHEILADGFRIALVVAEAPPGASGAAFRAILFDGGRATASIERIGFDPADAGPYLALRSFLAAVAAPPHLLAGAGRGWRRIVADALSERLPLYRVLDLAGTARAFRPAARARDGLEGLARTWGLTAAPADLLASGVWADLLWAVVHEAGTRALGAAGMLTAAEDARTPHDFARCAFDAVTLAGLPETPGVYTMLDEAGRAVYVGQSGNLRRRLQEHFQGALELPEKARRIRDRVRDFEIHPVGSELEALLHEERRIRELAPDMNVQRAVAEGAGRYGEPLQPAAIVAHSARPGRVELFLLMPARTLLQTSFDPRRPPVRLLEQLALFLAGRARKIPRAKSVTDWGAGGAELCARHLGRARGRLRWCPVEGDDPAAIVATWVAAARDTLVSPPAAEEWRMLPPGTP